MSAEEENKRPPRRQRASRLPPEAEAALEAWQAAMTPEFDEKQQKKFMDGIREKAGLKKPRPKRYSQDIPWTEEDERLANADSIEASIELADRHKKEEGKPGFSEAEKQEIRDTLQQYEEKFQDPQWNKEFMEGTLQKAGLRAPPQAEEMTSSEEARQRQWAQDIIENRQTDPQKRQR